jgi:hypothetical protein
MKQTLSTTLALGLLSFAGGTVPHAQRYLVNGPGKPRGKADSRLLWLRRRRLADGWLGYLAGHGTRRLCSRTMPTAVQLCARCAARLRRATGRPTLSGA